jgi:teichuronic acid biosynthesis glycosyltransferase TuaC
VKVLFVASGNSWSGLVPFIRNQGESLKKNGIDLDYFIIKGKGPRGYLSAIGKLRQKIKGNNYDIMHAHYGFCGWAGILTFAKIPKVVSFMGTDLFGDRDERGRKRFSDFLLMSASQISQVFVDCLIVKSNRLADHVLFKKKMKIIPNGVDFDLFKPLDKDEAIKQLLFEPEKNKKCVLFLGDKKVTIKNFPLLRMALSEMRGVELLNPYPIDHVKIPLYLNLADVLVLTSYEEGSPNVIKEAMACNCPIVSTDVGDVKEIIGNTEGCYITTFDPADVAGKIRKALQFGRRTDGRKAINHLEINFIARKIINVYKEVLMGA